MNGFGTHVPEETGISNVSRVATEGEWEAQSHGPER
jgi:hypothetical protein